MGLVSNLIARPQNLGTSSELDAWLRRGTNNTWAGVSVTPQTALQVCAVFACTRVIAEDIGKLPFVVYRQDDETGRDRANDSPYWKLLHDKPNSFQTSQQFREYLTACALLRGNGFAFKNLVGGSVRELLPLHPDRVRIEQLDDFEIIYHVTLPNRREEPMTRREIFHLPGLTITGPVGVSIVENARQTIGNALGAGRHSGTFFGKGMKPSGTFVHPKALKPETRQRLKDDLIEKHGGENSNDVLLLEEGMEFKPVSMNARDSQFLESRTFEVLEVCRWFRVPPHKIAELTRATFSNIEMQGLDYVTDTLMSWAKRWEYAVNQQVIVTNNLYAEILFDALMRGTTYDRFMAYQIAAGGNAPWMNRNEIRRRENLHPIEGLDTMLVPLNMGGGSREEASDESTDD